VRKINGFLKYKDVEKTLYDQFTGAKA